MISETNWQQFPNISVYYDRLLNSFQVWSDKSWDGILLFVREYILFKIIKTDCDADFERIFIEINLRKKKWLLCCSYNPRKSNIANHLKNNFKTFDKLNSTYDNLFLSEDFNTEPEEKVLLIF